MQKYISFMEYFEPCTQFFFSGPECNLHYNPFKYLFLASTKIRGGHQERIIPVCAKNYLCSLKNLSESTSSSFWTNWMVCTATLILSPTCSPPCQTLKSRSMHHLDHFWFMKYFEPYTQLFFSGPECIFALQPIYIFL